MAYSQTAGIQFTPVIPNLAQGSALAGLRPLSFGANPLSFEAASPYQVPKVDSSALTEGIQKAVGAITAALVKKADQEREEKLLTEKWSHDEKMFDLKKRLEGTLPEVKDPEDPFTRSSSAISGGAGGIEAGGSYGGSSAQRQQTRDSVATAALNDNSFGVRPYVAVTGPIEGSMNIAADNLQKDNSGSPIRVKKKSDILGMEAPAETFDVSNIEPTADLPIPAPKGEEWKVVGVSGKGEPQLPIIPSDAQPFESVVKAVPVERPLAEVPAPAPVTLNDFPVPVSKFATRDAANREIRAFQRGVFGNQFTPSLVKEHTVKGHPEATYYTIDWTPVNPKKEVEGALRQNFFDLVHEHGY